VLEDLAGRSRLIVATGGGAPAQAVNRGFFTGSAAVFHLRVSLAAARERTKGGQRRPLLQKDPDTVQRLYESRMAVYNELGAAVDTNGKTPLAVAEEILGMIRNPRRSRIPGDSA
jgi:shikimate kinase